MSGTIFICYRRGEDAGVAGRLYDRLEHTFGHQHLFMDVDNILPGEDFAAVLEAQVAACDVLLALIGRGWLTATDKTGHYCLENPDDFVRIEIASGLVQGKRVIPVLVDDATIPRANELPDEMMPLARRQAVRITHERFKDDVERLVRVLEKALAEAEALRKAAEEERQRRQQEEAEALRKAAEEERQRRQQEEAEALRKAAEEERQRRQQEEAETARVPKAAYNNDARKTAIWLLAAIIIFAAGAALILPGRNWFTPMERNAPAWIEPTPPTTSVLPTSPEADKTREEPTQTQPGETVPPPAWIEPTPPTTSVLPTSPEADKTREEPTQTQPGETVSPPDTSAKQLRPPSESTEPTWKKSGKQLPKSPPERDRASLLCGDIMHRRQLGEVLSDEDLRYLTECQ